MLWAAQRGDGSKGWRRILLGPLKSQTINK